MKLHFSEIKYPIIFFPCSSSQIGRNCGAWPYLTMYKTNKGGEGNGTPLQCSCLENPRDGGAWWAAIYGVAQSWTRLKRLSSSKTNKGGFPGGSDSKESSCNEGDLGLIPALERAPGEGNGYPLQYSGLENSIGYTVHGAGKESDTTEAT